MNTTLLSAELAPHMADTRRTITYPTGPLAGNLECIKMRNPDPNAIWDFWMMMMIQTVGNSSQVMTIIPLEGGGYRKMTSRVHSKSIQKIDSITTYRSKSLNFGFVSLSKMKVRKFYQEVRLSLFATRGHAQDFDIDGVPVGEPQAMEDVIWPDLPGDEEISSLLRSLEKPRGRLSPTKPEPLSDLSLGVFFPTVEGEGEKDEDFMVSEGEIFLSKSIATARSQPRDGIRIETSFQDGIPTLVTHDYFLFSNGKKKRLFGDRCAQRVFHRVVEIYKDSKKRGLFSSKRKLKVIRRILRIESFEWSDT